MRILEQRIIQSGEASVPNASLVDMQQTVMRLMTQCNEKSFELEDFMLLKDGVVHPSSIWRKARFGEDTIITNINTSTYPWPSLEGTTEMATDDVEWWYHVHVGYLIRIAAVLQRVSVNYHISAGGSYCCCRGYSDGYEVILVLSKDRVFLMHLLPSFRGATMAVFLGKKFERLVTDRNFLSYHVIGAISESQLEVEPWCNLVVVSSWSGSHGFI
ncbi:hypothetical protein Ancab_001098 [Ancistrocladus abbreviatus]